MMEEIWTECSYRWCKNNVYHV